MSNECHAYHWHGVILVGCPSDSYKHGMVGDRESNVVVAPRKKFLKIWKAMELNELPGGVEAVRLGDFNSVAFRWDTEFMRMAIGHSFTCAHQTYRKPSSPHLGRPVENLSLDGVSVRTDRFLTVMESAYGLERHLFADGDGFALRQMIGVAFNR